MGCGTRSIRGAAAASGGRPEPLPASAPDPEEVGDGDAEAGQDLAAVQLVAFGQLAHGLAGGIDRYSSAAGPEDPEQRHAGSEVDGDLLLDLARPVVGRDDLDDKIGNHRDRLVEVLLRW